jgi:uncharacterized protein YndB with AHSA1/START domain
MNRTDRGSRRIEAEPGRIYQAMTDPQAIVSWRPPKGMKGEMLAFDAREGGAYRMTLIYEDQSIQGKTSSNVDVVEGRFQELVPGKRMVEVVTFESDDPAFAGEMTITTTLTPIPGGTEVQIVCENVPSGISAADHEAGLTSTLQNLATYTEGRE